MPVAGGEPVHLAEGISPSWSADGRRIVYAREDSLTSDIWTIPASGGTPEPFYESPEMKYWPRYSPDGSQILFTQSDILTGDIYVVDVSGLRN